MKKTIHSPMLQPDRSSRGSALLIGMFCVLVAGMLATNLTQVVQQDIHASTKLICRTQALEIADGAASQALAAIMENTETIDELPGEVASGELGGGTYSVSLNPLGSGAYVLHSLGTVRDTTEQVKVYFNAPVSKAAFMRGMFANHDLDANGGGGCYGNAGNGTHSNQNSSIRGSVEVLGDASSAGVTDVRGAARVTGTVSSGVDPIPFPQLDYDHYYRIAESNGEVYTGDQTLKGNYSPAGGVMWVVGDVRVRSKTRFHGALFATGDIDQAGKCEFYQVNNLPAMVSRDGNIFLHGRCDRMEGLVYAGSGNIEITGRHRIYGAVWAWGYIFARGNWGTLDFELQEPEIQGSDRVTLTAWER